MLETNPLQDLGMVNAVLSYFRSYSWLMIIVCDNGFVLHFYERWNVVFEVKIYRSFIL